MNRLYSDVCDRDIRSISNFLYYRIDPFLSGFLFRILYRNLLFPVEDALDNLYEITRK